MKKNLIYDTTNFKISQPFFDRELTAKTESMMALGNGYLGIRSADEEKEEYNKEDLFVNGIFNKADDKMVSELANLADPISTKIIIDNQVFSIQENDKYLKTLDIKKGSLKREIKIKRNKKEFLLVFERFVSQYNQNVFAQKITIKQISGQKAFVKILPKINGQTTNHGSQHFKEGDKKRITLESLQYIEKTNESQRKVIHNMVLKSKLNDEWLKGGNDDFVVVMARRQIGFAISFNLKANESFELEKLMSVNTSIDKENYKNEQLEKDALNLHHELLESSYQKLFEQSNKKWKDIFKQFDVKIIGKNEDASYDYLALIFSIMHINSFVPKKNSNLSIGAKGLSGEGYQGHCYWDTEFFIVPNYLFTKPKIARNLLEYRYKGIQGARNKAKEKKERQEESNLEGAQYPWEMAWPSDGEVCPYWGQADIVSGKQEPIASRRQEIHVSADVAFAVDQYYTCTNDKTFMNEMGYEMIVDTAFFWANRAEKQKDGTYEIKDVMGPNEYKGNIDNNAYTNAFAKKNIELALNYIDFLNKTESGKKQLEDVLAKIPYEASISKMKDVKEKLKQQKPNENLVIAENDQFLKLPLNNVTPFQLLGDAGKKLFNTTSGHKLLGSQLVKQADIVLLTYLMPELFSKKVIKRNFEYYEPITTHDSSLSPTTYAIQAIQLRKMKKAYQLYKYSLNIDLGTNMQSCNTGIHAGALAAIWQSTIFGYGGMRYFNNQLHFSPILPKQWDKLEYSVFYKNVKILVKVDQKQFSLQAEENKKIKVVVNGFLREITPEQQCFEVQNEY